MFLHAVRLCRFKIRLCENYVRQFVKSYDLIQMSYSELKHCRLLAFHSRVFVCFTLPFFISHLELALLL